MVDPIDEFDAREGWLGRHDQGRRGLREKLLREKGGLDAGCHTNFSMKSMREKGGFDVMLKVALVTVRGGASNQVLWCLGVASLGPGLVVLSGTR